MPYNTRRKSLSLPSLGIHVPVTHAERAAAASKMSGRPSTSSSASPSSAASSLSPPRSESPETHPSKRLKRSHGDAPTDQTPPPSPTPSTSVDMSDPESIPKVDLEGINDDIVEAVISQLQSTANRPHLIKELAAVLTLSLASVQNSANPCAIISSRLTSYMKRPCWSALARCPLAKELEPVHPRRTYFFLTTFPRQPLPDSSSAQPAAARNPIITPSVSLTDDSGSDDVDSRRRELSPSPEVDLSPPDFDEMDDDMSMPMTPMGSLPKHHVRDRDLLQASPPLEKDEREFTQTADVLQKRKLNDAMPPSETSDRGTGLDFGYRDEIWFGEIRGGSAMTFLTSPAMKPSVSSGVRRDDEPESWLAYNKLFELDKGAESIEIDELDCLLDGC